MVIRPYLLGLLGLSGCDAVFMLEDPPVEPFSCETGAIFDEFDDPQPCRPWGFATVGGAELIQTGGHLSIRPAANRRELGSCTAGSAAAFLNGGIFVEVSSMFATANTYAALEYFEVTPPDALIAHLLYSTGRMMFASSVNETQVEHAAADYDPVAMRWWRMRPDHEIGAIIADFSRDGRRWTTFGVAPGVVPIGMKLDFVAGTYDETATDPGSFTVERLGVCPE